MKPDFALSLSFDGIRLLHRAAGGWRLVGEVALDTADLAAELATLRKTATALAPGGLRSKVLLPDEQIKYLTIDTPNMSLGERRDAARQALDGATPYRVSDLAFDISTEGDRTHIAAVARETLEEAEAFAEEHRFHPVSFAAVPDNQAYLGEPFFGQALGAAELLEGETVEPDGVAVVVVGRVDQPKGPVVPEEEAAPDVAEEPLPPPAVPVEEPPAAKAEEAVPKEEATLTPPPFRSSEPPKVEETAPPPVLPSLGGARRQEPAPAAAPKAPAASREAPATGFASRRGRNEPPAPKPPAASVIDPSIDDLESDLPPVAAPALSEKVEPKAPKAGFLSRRRAKAPAAPKVTAKAKAEKPIPAPRSKVDRVDSEAERMTIFGARKGDVGGKPRFLGLVLTAVLLIFLAGVAAWAAVFLDDGLQLSRLFGDRGEPERAFSDPLPDPPPAPTADAPAAEPEQRMASLDPDPLLSEEDSAVLEALRRPVEPVPAEELTEAELEAKYAATGIWTRAPEAPDEPAGLVTLEDLYLTSIDPVSTATDALALPAQDGFGTDLTFAALPSPAAPGTRFDLDDRGLVRATPEGTVTPEGVTVYLGKPPLLPPPTPTRFQDVPVVPDTTSRLAAFRPQTRPGDLTETFERGRFGGLTRSELADMRPYVRPGGLAARAEPELATPETDEAVAAALAEPSPFENATSFATQASLRPDPRPRNFSRIVKRAQREAPKAEETRVASTATIAPRAVQPKIPSKTSVAKQATVKNAINLRKINLIGVYGKPSNRRALVRLGNGRYRKVEVGDRLDGGRVSAIGEAELRYRKGSRNLVLKMPRS